MAIEVLGNLCLGVAHQPNKALQKEIASTDALALLINYMLSNRNLQIKVTIRENFSVLSFSVLFEVFYEHFYEDM